MYRPEKPRDSICVSCKGAFTQMAVTRGAARCPVCRDAWREYKQVGCGRLAASNEVARARRRGDLKSPRECVCVDCGVQAIEYDHRDYAKQLDVVPVCRRCNLRRGAAKPVAAFVVPTTASV